MRYALSEIEWSIVRPIVPNKSKGVPRVYDRRVINGIFWILRSAASWRDLPDRHGPYTTCYNRFVRWRRAGIWGRIMEWLSAADEAAVQMIDTIVGRVHQHGACIANNSGQQMGRSCAGLTSKIHVVVDANGLPIHLGLTGGQVHSRLCSALLRQIPRHAQLLTDRDYDADWIRILVAWVPNRDRRTIARLPPITPPRKARRLRPRLRHWP